MAGRILKEDVETLRRQADIVAVVGDYTTVKRAGKSFKGLCPFHTEKTPSFTVTPDGNFFHCFGCGASGDIYDFLMRIEGLEFPEAVESLARRTGFPLRYEELSSSQRQQIGERSRLVDVAAAARDYFRRTLLSEDGKVARDYLKARGFHRDDAEAFELGFATLSWSGLVDALTADGFSSIDLIATGLAVKTDSGRLRDRFRGRLIFPVADAGGDVIGFGGRVLPELDYGDFTPPKYLNSPETVLYKKARVLYGLPLARAEMVRSERVLICEGYTDVMALHQAGVTNVVATCGTAVGDEHLRMVSRYASKVVLAFDADEAGVKAAERAWQAARDVAGEQHGAALDVRVLELAPGSDPADMARDDPDGLSRAVDNAIPVVPFVVRHQLDSLDTSDEAGRAQALRTALGIIGNEPDPDLRREWARTEIADRVGVAYDFVAQTARRMNIALDAHEGVAVATSNRSGTLGRPADNGHQLARARRERAVLRVLLQQPQLLPDEWFDITAEMFTHPKARAVFDAVSTAGGAGVELDSVLATAADDQERDLIRAIALEDDDELWSTGDDDPDVAAQVARERICRVLIDAVDDRQQQLRAELTQLHHERDGQQVRDLQEQLLSLQRRRRQLLGEP
ncbi:MAG: DNA primase [Nitriliruptoraceae bacterium]